MTITWNGASVRTPHTTLADLLHERLGEPRPEGVAGAVNGEVVPRSTWPVASLTDGDVVDVVTAVQGG